MIQNSNIWEDFTVPKNSINTKKITFSLPNGEIKQLNVIKFKWDKEKDYGNALVETNDQVFLGKDIFDDEYFHGEILKPQFMSGVKNNTMVFKVEQERQGSRYWKMTIFWKGESFDELDPLF